MSQIDQAITATDIMNFAYCPRIIHFVYVLKQPQFTTVKEFKGREKFTEWEKKSSRNKLIRDCSSKLPKRRNLYLYDPETNLKTFVDCVLFNEEAKEAYPFQIKYGYQPKALYLTQKYQLWLEGYLIEKMLDYKVPYGYIKYTKDNSLVKISLGIKGEILKVAEQIKSIIGNELFPEPTPYMKRCVDCCYRRMC